MQIAPAEIAVVVASAVAGCFATSLVFNVVTGKPAAIVAGNWRKHLWSIIFALPALVIFDLSLPLALALLVLVGWLILAPSLASKFIFGPKDAAWSFLLMLHSAYGFTTLAGILILKEIFAIA